MGSYRRDRSHRESQLGRIDPVTQPLRAELHGLAATESAPATALRRFERPCQVRHQDAVKIPGRERYVTDSRTAAKPSSGFTIHACQAFRALVLVNLLQTRQIELQNVLHSPETNLVKMGPMVARAAGRRA